MNRKDNLIPLTKDTAKKIGQIGGIKSGQARRRKADLKAAINALLTEQTSDGITKEVELVVAMFKAAVDDGDVKAAEWLAKYSAQQTKTDEELRRAKALAKKQEEYYQAQIDLLKAKLQADQNEEKADDGFIEALRGTVSEDWEGVADETEE